MNLKRLGTTFLYQIFLTLLLAYLKLVLFFFYWWGGTKSLGTAATSGLLYKPQMIDEVDCGAIGGMKVPYPTKVKEKCAGTRQNISLPE
jgi:hypothetical protein